MFHILDCGFEITAMIITAMIISINANKTEGAICPLRIMIVTVNIYMRLVHVPMGFLEKYNEFV